MLKIKKKILACVLSTAIFTSLWGCSSQELEESVDLFRETVQNTLSSQEEPEEEETAEIPEVSLLLWIQYSEWRGTDSISSACSRNREFSGEDSGGLYFSGTTGKSDEGINGRPPGIFLD